MSGVPKTQAGMASGMNSSSRQLGQSLGVAIVGTVLAASMRGSMQAGFVQAARAGWWIMAGCGYVVLLLGLVCTTAWAKGTASRLDPVIDLTAGNASAASRTDGNHRPLNSRPGSIAYRR